MVDLLRKFSPADFAFFREKGERARKGVNPEEAGPIAPETSDKEIRARATRIGYNTAGGTNSAFLPEYVLRLERRIAVLENELKAKRK